MLIYLKKKNTIWSDFITEEPTGICLVELNNCCEVPLKTIEEDKE